MPRNNLLKIIKNRIIILMKKKKTIERRVVDVVRKKDHLEVHYSDGRVIKTMNFQSGNDHTGVRK